jgi:hypothetical protein
MKTIKLAATLTAIGLLFASTQHASAITIFAPSPVVTSADRSATFDSLTSNGISLAAYSEDSLSVTVNNITFQGFQAFSPGDLRTTAFHYGNGGDFGFVTIKGTDGAAFTAIDFLLGDGQGPPTTNVRWEAYRGGFLTGSGTQPAVARGTVVGWTDAAGFDELRVAAASSELSPGFGNHQSIAIDDLRATLVPEPSIFALAALASLCIGFNRRKRLS